MKVLARTSTDISVTAEMGNPHDELTLRFFRKFRTTMLQYTGHAVIAATLRHNTQDALLTNHQLLAILTKVRSVVPVVTGESSDCFAYDVELPAGEVRLSNFNCPSKGILFADANQKDDILETSLTHSCSLRLYLHKSSFVSNTQAFNMSLLFDTFGAIDEMIIFDSHHAVITNYLVTDCNVTLSVMPPHNVDLVFENAKRQLADEISRLSF